MSEASLGFMLPDEIAFKVRELSEFMGFETPYDMIVSSIETMWAEYVRHNG